MIFSSLRRSRFYFVAVWAVKGAINAENFAI